MSLLSSRALVAVVSMLYGCDSEVNECPERQFPVVQYVGEAIDSTTLECSGSVTGPCDDIEDPATLTTGRHEVCDATVFPLRGEGNARFVRLLVYKDNESAGVQIVDARDDDDSSEFIALEPDEAIIEIDAIESDAASGRFELFFDDGRIVGTFNYQAP